MGQLKIRNLAVVGICLLVSTGYALAGDHGHGREHRNHGQARHEWRRDHQDQRRHWEHARHDQRGRERRRREHYRSHNRPSGWDHGRKQGWHGQNVPPGQAKPTAYSGSSPAYRPNYHRQPWLTSTPQSAAPQKYPAVLSTAQAAPRPTPRWPWHYQQTGTTAAR